MRWVTKSMTANSHSVLHQPRRQNQDGLHEQRRPAFLRIDPSDNIVNLLNIELDSQHIVLQMEHRLENDLDEADDDQHLNRRERHLAKGRFSSIVMMLPRIIDFLIVCFVLGTFNVPMLVELILRMFLVTMTDIRLCFPTGMKRLDEVVAVISRLVTPHLVNGSHQSSRCSQR